jgi:serine protease Do
VPAAVVRYVYEQLRTRGFVRQSLVGVHVQTITPALAQGLGLSRGYGVMIADVLPASAAGAAGLRPRDIITAVDGVSISALPYYAAMMYVHDPAVPVAVTAMRGDQTLQFQVPAVAGVDLADKDSSIGPHESLVPELGIFGKAVDTSLSFRNALRSNAGVYVVATIARNADSGTALTSGDVIASLNGIPILGIQELGNTLRELTANKTAVVQIERQGMFMYIERELE